MIFGAVSFDGKIFDLTQQLASLGEILSWPGCAKEYYPEQAPDERCLPIESLHTHFYGAFLSDPRLPDYRKDAFYCDDEHELIILADGYLYNANEIKERLNGTNQDSSQSLDQFNIPSDDQPEIKSEVLSYASPLPLAELIAKAYLTWGEDFANRLNGDFAICIYHTRLNKVLFFRDHLGNRPLAISRQGDTIFFATDPMGLCKALHKEEPINPDFMLNLFLHMSYDFTILPHKAVFRLKPGHAFIATPDKNELKRFWFPHQIKTDQSLTRERVLADLRPLLEDAVKTRCDRRFKASAHVSGGLDSGIVTAYARNFYAQQPDFYGFSWSPDFAVKPENPKHDDRLLVTKTCEKLQIIPEFCALDQHHYCAFFSEWRHRSELLYEGKVVEKATERGINLLFSGWGGDEFISIINRGIDPDLIRAFDWRHFIEKYPPRQTRHFLRQLFNAIYPAKRNRFANIKAYEEIYPFIRKRLGSNHIPLKQRFSYNSRRDIMLGVLDRSLHDSRTADWYVLGQRNGIEYRYPLLDKRIVEYMLKVPSRCLVDGKKDRIILRTLGKGLLPEEVLANRSKDDPLKSDLFDAIGDEHRPLFISEFDSYRQNPDLSFVDFQLMEEQYPEIAHPDTPPAEGKDYGIFYCLKHAHEFTKGYYA